MAAKIDSRLLEALQASSCFGLAHDDSVPECKQCDVKAQCERKSDGADIPTPVAKVKSTPTESKEEKNITKKAPKATDKPKVEKPKTVKPAVKKDVVAPPANLPDFKPMSLDELKELAQERSVEWKEYGNDNITRMRLIMALKKSY